MTKPDDNEIMEAVDRFEGVKISHELQKEAVKTVLFLLTLSPNTEIVNLIGPTGIGKSFLQGLIIDALQKLSWARMQAEPSHVPVFRTHAVAAGHRAFSWKTFYRDALLELGDPFAGHRKAAPGATRERLFPGESPGAAELRMAVQREVKYRGTKVWIIDEAQHMAFGMKSGEPGHQLDVLKSIAQTTGMKLLLAGPHELEGALLSSAQLARRSMTVHYGRYQAPNASHMKQFGSAVQQLFKEMKVAGFPSVKENIRFFYVGCAGCIGILKDWLARAFGFALREAPDVMHAVITLDHLTAARLPGAAIRRIVADMRDMEEAQTAPTSDDEYMQIVLGTPQPAQPAAADFDAAVAAAVKKVLVKAGLAASVAKRPKQRVGERAPGPRDPVGLPDPVPVESASMEEAL